MVATACVENPSIHIEEVTTRVEYLLEWQKVVPSCAARCAVRADFTVQYKHLALKISTKGATLRTLPCAELRVAWQNFWVTLRISELCPGLVQRRLRI